MQQYSPEQKLYALAYICRDKGLTPNDNRYLGVIIKLVAANFNQSEKAAKEYAKTLTTKYRADHWARLLGSAYSPSGYEPTLTLQKEKPATQLQHIQIQAQRDTFNGVGRLCIKELEYDGLTADRAIELWRDFNDTDTIEQRGDYLYIYWGGREAVKTRRIPIIPENKPLFKAANELHKDEPLEKADFTADKEVAVGGFEEDTEGTVEDESDNDIGFDSEENREG